jgi:hypothetical protein
MRKGITLLSVILFFGLVLMACAPAAGPQATVPAAVQPPATELPVSEGQIPVTGPTVAEPLVAAHIDVPGNPPSENSTHLGDQDSSVMADKKRAPEGDRFTFDRFERPFNANTMDVYLPFVDIRDVNFSEDPTWVYTVITLTGRDANNAFPAKYAIEIDLELDGRGDLLVLANQPSAGEWSTDGVQVLWDENGDIGGERILETDGAGAGDGYEAVIFDQGQGNDPDAAWARLSPDDPNSLQIAFKQTLLGGDKAYLVGVWAGTDDLNPSLFDLNDHFTHEQAGAANPDFEYFYPIKEVSELDNTCRTSIGFEPSGKEPGLCYIPGLTGEGEGCTLTCPPRYSLDDASCTCVKAPYQ